MKGSECRHLEKRLACRWVDSRGLAYPKKASVKYWQGKSNTASLFNCQLRYWNHWLYHRARQDGLLQDRMRFYRKRQPSSSTNYTECVQHVARKFRQRKE